MTPESISKGIRIEAVFPDGFLRAGKATHTWRVHDPLAVEVKFTIVMNSVPITRDEFPHGMPACEECLARLRFGTFGVVQPENGALKCINCSTFGETIQTQEETWTVGLGLYVDALLDKADRQGQFAADVQLTRPSKNYLLMVVRDEDGQMKVSIPITPLKSFLHMVNEARKELGPMLDKTYTELGISALEKLANGVE